MPKRDYAYFDFTTSLCSTCLRRVDAKILFQNDKVIMRKYCPSHGGQDVLISTDIPYYLSCRTSLKPGETPLHFHTPTRFGCPYDCGLCPDHEQHSCLTVLEVTDRCNLRCPTCYSASGPDVGRHLELEEIEARLDAVVASEGQPDIVQISGGEPTIHPRFFDILDAAKRRPIRHLMLNTNGVRIASEPDFAKRLAQYAPAFEVYLQFDGLDAGVLQNLRGADLSTVRMKALAHLEEQGLSTTLVVTLKRGLNNQLIGEVVDFALQYECIRGITFQPIQIAGRVEGVDPALERYTLSEVRRDILSQHHLFKEQDIIPVPCNPDALAMGYALKLNGSIQPLSDFTDPSSLLTDAGNTIVFEGEPAVREAFFQLYSTAMPAMGTAGALKKMLCCIPGISAPNISYKQVFRVVIMAFMDAWNFDVRAIKKSCVHMATGDGKMIPFETMNLFYRDGKRERLAQLQQAYDPANFPV